MKKILQEVAAGELSLKDAEHQLSMSASHDREDVVLDFSRFQRCGVPEVIFCEGKNVSQIQSIIHQFMDKKHPVFGTRVDLATAEELQKEFPALHYDDVARAITLDLEPLPRPIGRVCIVSAGTSDETVAAEAGLTATRMGADVFRISDVGVAGLHRLMARLDEIREANAVVVVAGMEGALPSVVGGLIDTPIIAVPTSVGYGFNFDGLTAFLAMMNSCVPGMSVVNMDNGFGAGIAAAQINRAIESAKT